jgi:hypothetical protein
MTRTSLLHHLVSRLPILVATPDGNVVAAQDGNVDAAPVAAPDGNVVAAQDGNVDAAPADGPARQRTVNFSDWPITSQKQNFLIRLPNSHCVMLKREQTRLLAAEKKLKSLQKGFAPKRTVQRCSSPSDVMSQYLTMALTSVPALAIKAAAYLIPLIVTAFLCDHDIIMDRRMDSFVKNFPSEGLLRKLMITDAAKSTLETSLRLDRALAVHLSCDKGNKKGMDHFVKYLSWWEIDDNGVGRVHKQMIDCNAVVGTHVECGLAIVNSLRKLQVATDRPVILMGQSTDSGGGGVLDGLARELKGHGVMHERAFIVSCGIHNLQLQLSRPIKELIGDGGIDNRNAMQLLHSIHDLQGYQDWNQCRAVMEEARVYSNAHYDWDLDEDDGIVTPGDIAYAGRWNIVRTFREFELITEEDSKW